MPMTTRGLTQVLPLCALRMKCWSIFSVTSKSAMTPSFMGRIATMLPGVRPSISLAAFATASTRFVILLIATMDGSLTTMPLPFAYTSVLAVPRSIARSFESGLNSFLRLITEACRSKSCGEVSGAQRRGAGTPRRDQRGRGEKRCSFEAESLPRPQSVGVLSRQSRVVQSRSVLHTEMGTVSYRRKGVQEGRPTRWDKMACWRRNLHFHGFPGFSQRIQGVTKAVVSPRDSVPGRQGIDA